MEKKAVISKVISGSLAEDIGLKSGDKIVKINNNFLHDLIDFQLYWADEEIELLVEKDNGEQVLYELEKDYDEGLGIEFEEAVFDKIRRCHNNCLFCFVDQMAPNMRKSLYEKDDDYRLSFLHGNFITLTNLNHDDIARIKKIHLSPLYVSVHTTDPELRIKLLGNNKAGIIKKQLEDLIKADIEIHTQIVLCPGINDGKYLDKTIDDLKKYWPSVRSIAVVPIGVTKFRKDLEKFPLINKEYATHIVENISEKQKKFREKHNNTFIYLADEFYIKAEKRFPLAQEYDRFPQIENGIGLCRLFIDEFADIRKSLPVQISNREYTIITSTLGAYILEPIINELSNIEGLKLNLKPINNVFFGSRVTVTGLLTGHDLLIGLHDIKTDSKIIIPDIMLKKGEDVFLDGLTPKDIEKKLKVSLIKVPNSAQGLINALIK